MDSIKAMYGLSPYCSKEHLCIYVNGIRLDELLSEADKYCLGLVPSLLDWYDERLKEKQYVWNQVKLENGTKILPIMLCPDDFDFACTTIVVEVIDDNETVIWNRFGVDITEFSVDELELPNYIGKEVEWFSNIKSFVFPKADYLECVKAFISSICI